MPGHRPFRKLFAKMPLRSQRRARAMAERELAALELGELRERLKLTQSQLAKRLRITQVAVSRIESRRDVRLSTLRDYIRAVGGELEVRAIFPDGVVKLTHVYKVRKEEAKPRAHASD